MGSRRIVMDAGNTKLRIALWEGGSQRPRADGLTGLVPLPLLRELAVLPTGGADAAALAARVEGILADEDPLPRVLSSVAPAVQDALAAGPRPPQEISAAMPLPFRLDVAEPAAVGADRLCNMAAAAAAGWPRALVVDAGTATTFDLLLDGAFVGGLIAPGMALAARCLGERAARLAPVPFGPCPLGPGRSTAEAMQRGAFHVGTLGVRAVIEALTAAHGPWAIVLTGGLGGLLTAPGRHLDPHWTLRGAALLAAD